MIKVIYKLDLSIYLKEIKELLVKVKGIWTEGNIDEVYVKEKFSLEEFLSIIYYM